MDSPPHPGCQLSPEGLVWHKHFARALEARDLEVYLAYLHDDCTLQINNAVPMYSKAAIRSAYTAYMTMYRSLTVEPLMLMGIDRQSCAEVLLNYVCNDGSTEVVQCAYLIDRDEAGLVTSARIYGNASRVFKSFMPAND